MASNVLDLEPQKVQKLGGGVQAPTIKVANEDVSGAVKNLTDTIMTISGSIIQENRRKEVAERKDLVKREKDNLENYNKIFMLQSSEGMTSTYSKATNEMETFFDRPEVFRQTVNGLFDSNFKGISSNKSLTELDKTRLHLQNKKEHEMTSEKFRTGLTKFNDKRNKTTLDTLGNKLIQNMATLVFDGNDEMAHDTIKAFAEVIKLGMEKYPDDYKFEDVQQTIGVMQSKYLEARVTGQIDRYKLNHDMDTEEGINDYIAQLVAYSKNFNSKKIKGFFNEVFKGLPMEQKNIGAKVHGMIKSQIEREKYLSNNKIKNIKEMTLEEERQLQLEPHKEPQDLGLIYSGINSNEGLRAMVIGNQLGIDIVSDIEAVKIAKANNLTYSLFHKNEMMIAKKAIEEFKKVNDSKGILGVLNEAYDLKVLDRDGFVAEPLDEEMFYKDIDEMTDGVIDRNYFKAYKQGNTEVIEDYEQSLRFASQNTLISGETGDLTLFDLERKPWLSRNQEFTALNDKITFMSIHNQDIQEPERLRSLANNWAYSYFYESILADEDLIKDFNSADGDKDRMKMMEKFYGKKANAIKLQKATERLSESFLGGKIIEIKSGAMDSKILVSEKYQDMDFETIKDNLIQQGNLYFVQPDGSVKSISPFKLRANLVIETTGEDRIGLFYKDQFHPLMFSRNGTLESAETGLGDISIFMEVSAKEKFKRNKVMVKDVKTKDDKKMMKIRNVRNNNAGNLKEVGIPWKGKLEGSDSGGRVASGSFTRFSTPQFGVRALNRDLTTKINRGLDTITKILNVYAPNGRENDTRSYIRAVSDATGLDPNQSIAKKDMFRLVKAIISHEGGALSLNYFTDSIIKEGMEMK